MRLSLTINARAREVDGRRAGRCSTGCATPRDLDVKGVRRRRVVAFTVLLDAARLELLCWPDGRRPDPTVRASSRRRRAASAPQSFLPHGPAVCFLTPGCLLTALAFLQRIPARPERYATHRSNLCRSPVHEDRDALETTRSGRRG